MLPISLCHVVRPLVVSVHLVFSLVLVISLFLLGVIFVFGTFLGYSMCLDDILTPANGTTVV